MTAPERLCPPQVLAFSTTATGTSPRRSIVSRIVAEQLQQAVGAGQAGGAAADDRHADLDQLVLGVEAVLDELLLRIDGRREGRGDDLPIAESRYEMTSLDAPFRSRIRPAVDHSLARFLGLHGLGQLGQDLVEIAHDPEV